MISIELLHALLQGLPSKFLEHLNPPWPLIATRIQLQIDEGEDPVSALKFAFMSTKDYERRSIRETLLQVLPVMQIPGLSYRQREALIALRSAKTASLSQLCQVLAQDRGNTFRRMGALVNKGLAFKFYRPGGVYYFAVLTPMEKSAKVAVSHFIDELIREASAGEFPAAPTTPTIST
jgi:hypothetical protein